MELGISLPTYAPYAPPRTIVRIALAAEQLGYDALWTFERLLAPIGEIDHLGQRGPVPEYYFVTYDPLETLAYIAARTSRIKLGVSVLDAPFHIPVVLAKRLATLDQFSGGRVIAGIGQGWMEQEFATANASPRSRGRRVEEFVAAMRASWGPDPVSFEGRDYVIPPSRINPKPVQVGGIPILMGAIMPVAIARAARFADGLNPVAMSFDSLQATIASFRAAARAEGRDPSALKIVVRANVPITADRLGDGRPFLGGSPDEIAEDVRRVDQLAVDHLFFAAPMLGVPPVHEQLRLLERLRSAIPAAIVAAA